MLLTSCDVCHQSAALLRKRYSGVKLKQQRLEATDGTDNTLIPKTPNGTTDQNSTGSSECSYLYCPTCASAILLKSNVDYLDNLLVIDQCKKQINRVLQNSLNSKEHTNIKFLTNYVKENNSDFAENDKHVSDEGPHLDDSRLSASVNMLSKSIMQVTKPSDASIAALSAQLLTVQSLILTKKINALQNNIKIAREKVIDELKAKRNQRREVLSQKTAVYETHASKLSESYLRLKQTLKKLHEKRTMKLNKTVTSINNHKAILFQTLCKFLVVKKLKPSSKSMLIQHDNSLLKKTLSQNGAHRLTMGLQPILPIDKIIHYNAKLLTSSFELICRFLFYASYYLQIDLPFKCDIPSKGSSLNYVVHGLNENYDNEYLKMKVDKKFYTNSGNKIKANGDQNNDIDIKQIPAIDKITPRNLLLILNTYSYDELFNSKNIVFFNRPLIKLNLIELFQVSVLLSKIIINLHTLCVKLRIVGLTDSNKSLFSTYSELFNIDEMLYLLVTGGSRLNGRQKHTEQAGDANSDSSIASSKTSYKKHDLEGQLKKHLSANEPLNVKEQHSLSPDATASATPLKKGSLFKYLFKNNRKRNTDSASQSTAIPEASVTGKSDKPKDEEQLDELIRKRSFEVDKYGDDSSQDFDFDFESYIEIKLEFDKKLTQFDNNDEKASNLALNALTFRVFRLLYGQSVILNQSILQQQQQQTQGGQQLQGQEGKWALQSTKPHLKLQTHNTNIASSEYGTLPSASLLATSLFKSRNPKRKQRPEKSSFSQKQTQVSRPQRQVDIYNHTNRTGRGDNGVSDHARDHGNSRNTNLNDHESINSNNDWQVI